MSADDRRARKELYEGPGGNQVDGLPLVPIVRKRLLASRVALSLSAIGNSPWGWPGGPRRLPGGPS
eukprot:2240063-Pyramimonas_sp.AAC.1